MKYMRIWCGYKRVSRNLMKKSCFLIAFLISLSVNAQSELIFGIPKELRDSISTKFSNYLIYEVNDMDGRMTREGEECQDEIYAAYLLIPLDMIDSMIGIKRNLCFHKKKEIGKGVWDFYLKNKKTLKSEKIRSNILWLHQKRQRLLIYENNKLELEIYLSEEYLRDENKFKAKNLVLFQVKLLLLIENEIKNFY